LEKSTIGGFGGDSDILGRAVESPTPHENDDGVNLLDSFLYQKPAIRDGSS
jgi:hypothetical protein